MIHSANRMAEIKKEMASHSNPIYIKDSVTFVCLCECMSDPFSKIIHSNHRTIPVPVMYRTVETTLARKRASV